MSYTNSIYIDLSDAVFIKIATDALYTKNVTSISKDRVSSVVPVFQDFSSTNPDQEDLRLLYGYPTMTRVTIIYGGNDMEFTFECRSVKNKAATWGLGTEAALTAAVNDINASL